MPHPKSKFNEKPHVALATPIHKNLVLTEIDGIEQVGLLDTGASISCVSQKFLSKLDSFKLNKYDPSSIDHIQGVCGEVHKVLGTIKLPICINGLILPHTFYVFRKLHHQLILGIDFLTAHQATICLNTKTLSLKDGQATVSLVQPTPYAGIARLCQDIIIPPMSECLAPVSVSKAKESETLLLEPTVSLVDRCNIAGAKCLVAPKHGQTVYTFLNPCNSTVHLKAKTIVATASHVDESVLQNELNPSKLVSEIEVANCTENEHEHDDEPNEKFISEAKKLGFNLDDADLTDIQKYRLLSFLGKNRDVFATNLSELGVTNVHSHYIDTGDARPIRQRFYRANPQVKAEIERQTDLMLEHGIIEKSISNWQSPVLLVPKPNGEYRFVTDYRKLNSVTKPMSFPLPRIEDVFDVIGESNSFGKSKSQMFSTLDLASGFWQIGLDPKTAHKTAFVTHHGQFQYKRLPFGLMNAPMTFQMCMSEVLRGLNWRFALIYIDDVLVFSHDFYQHLDHLDQIFQRFRDAKLTLRPSKCKFAAKSVPYLGHVISKHGIAVNPDKTDAIRSFPTPQTQRQLRSFLGASSYYRRFIKSYSLKAQPLYKLLHKNVKFQWDADCEKAFQSLKQALVSPPILAFPDMNQEFVLSVDASGMSLGFILGQLDNNGRERVIAYGGRALRPSEQKWQIYERECLALVEGIKTFHHYLANVHFIVYTDNHAAKWLQTVQQTSGRLMRWALHLQGYNFTIKHRAGTQNTNADALSRRIYPADSQKSALVNDDTLDVPIFNIEPHTCVDSKPHYKKEWLKVTFDYSPDVPNDISVSDTTQTSGTSEMLPACSDNVLPSVSQVSDLSTLQTECEDFKCLLAYMKTNEVPDDPKTAKRIVAEADQYVLINEVLYHLYYPRQKGKAKVKTERIVKQLAVPKPLREEVLHAYHDSLAGGGHQGFERTYHSIRMKYYWPRMYKEIYQYVQSCEACQQAKRYIHAHPASLHPLPIGERFSRWHVDILGPLTTTPDGYKYILLCVDSFTKWCEAFPLKTQEASEVAHVIYREIFTRYGAPQVLITDQGRNFMSKLVQALCELFRVTRHRTSSYHPQTNSCAERVNSSLAQALRAYCSDKQTDWADILPGILMAFRMSPATQSTLQSPYFLVFGEEMRVPLDTHLIPKDNVGKTFQHHLTNILENLKLGKELATKNMEIAQEAYKTQYDKKAKEPGYEPGQRVWLYCAAVPKGLSRKLHRVWCGPYYITLAPGNHVYVLRRCSDNKELPSRIHANRLKPYFDPKDRPQYPPPVWSGNHGPLSPEEISPDTPEVQDQISDSQNQPTQSQNSPDTPRSQRIAKDILKATRQNGKMWYKVCWGPSDYTWELSENVPDALKRAYHVSHTLQGKKRKKPLQRHKFFK